MKTILFISPTGTLDNGAEVSIFNLMKFLASEGYRVINIAPTQQRQATNDYSNECSAHGIECLLINTQRWWWEDAPGHLFGSETDRAVSFRETIKKIAEVIEESQVDLVISNTINVFQGALAAAIKSKPHFWLIHEFPENEFAYYIDKLDFITAYSTEIFAVNGKLHEKVASLFPERTIRAFSPYTEIKRNPLKPGTKHRIVSIGRISERKNQLELIQAFEKIDRKDLELVFIGGWDEPYKVKCQEYIKKNRITKVRFLGNKNNPWAEITDKDICVFPSAMETFGLVYVEALLNGIPVILSDNPGHTSAYQMFQFGQLYPSGSIEQLVDNMNEMIENFDSKKSEAVLFKQKAEAIYQVSAVYKDIITEVQKSTHIQTNSLRHIANILTLDEKKSKLAKLEFRVRQKLQRILYKIRRN